MDNSRFAMRLFVVLLLTAFLFASNAFSQSNTHIKGVVINGFTKDPIPYANLRWSIQKTGVTTDSLGKFRIQKSVFLNDTLILDYVGFDSHKYGLNELTKENLSLTLEKLSFSQEATVKTKFNKGLRWWKLVVANFPKK